MTGEPIITIIGGLTADPELRFTPSGTAVANFTIAATPETFDRNSNEWRKGETLYMRCAAWNKGKALMAEHITESLTKGTQVIAQGRLKSRSYETKEGEKRTVQELEIDAIGPTLMFGSVTFNRGGTSTGGGQSSGYDQGAAAGGWGGQPASNGWGAAAASAEPPF